MTNVQRKHNVETQLVDYFGFEKLVFSIDLLNCPRLQTSGVS